MSVIAVDGISVSVRIWVLAEPVKGEFAAGVDTCAFVEIWVLAVKGGLAPGVDACTFDEIWVLADSVKGADVV